MVVPLSIQWIRAFCCASLLKDFTLSILERLFLTHDDVIKWKHCPRYWPFVRGIHRSTVNSPHKGQWRGALVFSVICAWINGWVNNRKAGDLRHHWTHYDVTVMTNDECHEISCNISQHHVIRGRIWLYSMYECGLYILLLMYLNLTALRFVI